MRKRIALIDDDPGRRAAFSHIFLGQGHHVEPYESTEEMRQHFPTTDLILLHDTGPALDEILKINSDGNTWYPVAAYSADATVDRAAEVMRLGAIDYLGWPISPEAIEKRLLPVMEGENLYVELIRRASEARKAVQLLTGRQREVLAGMSEGLTSKEIARRLEISPRTVEIHRAVMKGKLLNGKGLTPHEIASYARIPHFRDTESPLECLDEDLPDPPDTMR